MVQERLPIKQAITMVRYLSKIDICVSTEFGVATISKKEAIHLLKTCECYEAILTINKDQVILEYPD